ncbi:aldehyde dehydrogenase [Microbacterium sp. B35-04]|uniref:aldehyde dehydrogenase family protein n=1 Tax=Microbacterium sp. B35-04 TaxID=1961716 RepID=UPI0013D74443|nr:aldehyde dehydrogenase family protein [Microbacterium sp. B35-04]KAF2412381.1 aldehyde dehydrogenase [Microbacterium sp. B35-04]
MAASAASTPLSTAQQEELDAVFDRARAALAVIETYDQDRVDRLIRAVAWAVANRSSFHRLVGMGIEESGLGDFDSRMNKRMKIRGVLRDALRSPSVGIIEEDREKGLVKYGKPVGVIGCVVPTTNPDLTPAGNAIYAIKARDVVVFSPHPRSKHTTFETVRLMREALEAEGAPADILQCITLPSLAASQEIMRRSDLVIATGGQGLVRAAYSSGTPAYGVGAGNATEFVDETADLRETARNCMLSKTSDFGSGCSADGNVLVPASRYREMIEALRAEGGYLATAGQRAALQAVMWDAEGHRLADTVAISPQQLARAAGFDIPSESRFIVVEGDGIAEDRQFCKEKLTTLMAVHAYEGGFEDGVELAKRLYEIGGKGHSCGIASTDDAHIDYFARHMPVSRIMVRQPNSKANAGSFTNGMPMTSSMGCGTWGGNITSENVSLRHYLNTTWVSRTIEEDRPTDEELFGEFYDPALESAEAAAATP